MTMADRIAVMSNGRFLQVGQPQDVYETPSCRFVADFIGNVNLLDGVLEVDAADHCVVGTPQGKFYVGHGLTGTAGMPVSVALRPEKIQLRPQLPAESQYNCMRGRITDSGYFGSFSLYRLTLDEGATLKVQITHAERHGALFQRGDEVFATCEPDALVVLKD